MNVGGGTKPVMKWLLPWQMALPVVLAVSIACSLGVYAHAAERKAARLTFKQQSMLRKAMRRFSKCGKREERAEIVTKIIGLGPSATYFLIDELEKGTGQAKSLYRSKLQKKVDVLLKSKTKDKPDEISKLQKQITSLRGKPNLTKADIVAEGDPALRRLHELFTVEMGPIIAKSAELKRIRVQLLEMYGYRESCMKAVGEKTRGAEEELHSMESDVLSAPLYKGKGANAVRKWNDEEASEIPVAEVEAIEHFNSMRLLAGLRALKTDTKLCYASRDHSKDMAERGFFAHQSPVPGKTTPWDRAKLAGTSARAENIFMGSNDGKAANEGWFHSPGHHVNMMNPAHKWVGIGTTAEHWTMMLR